MVTITGLTVRDIRFPTRDYIGDAMNLDPDYSAAYVVLSTDVEGLEGHGLTFTIGRGTEVVCCAVRALAHLVVGYTLEEFSSNMGRFWRHITGDSQLRWIGPEKGAIHLATGAVVNAVWDLWAKHAGKPVWRLVADMTPEELVAVIDFRYITDAVTPEEALELFRSRAATKAQRIAELEATGYPAYTTSAGWIGYSVDKVKALTAEAVAGGMDYVKIKVGSDLKDDLERCGAVREVLGPDRKLMVDANQKWEVGQAIEWMKHLAPLKPWWIEEPTSPDDILGHKKVREALKEYGIGVATGEHCQNRIIFKQLIMADAIDFVQIDSCRLAGVNEVLAVYLMAAKYGKPVCPHAGGVGLCEYVQHLAMIDYVCISGRHDDRVLEWVDHLHDHFVDPVVMRSGHYMPPKAAGYTITMKPESLAAHEYPTGSVWVEELERRKADVKERIKTW
jgi:L-fuconate dehydratase